VATEATEGTEARPSFGRMSAARRIPFQKARAFPFNRSDTRRKSRLWKS
jgi:hypothetical protein